MNHPSRAIVKDWPAYVKTFRVRHGLTQQELANKLHCGIRHIEDVEQGRFSPRNYLKRALRDLERELALRAVPKQ